MIDDLGNGNDNSFAHIRLQAADLIEGSGLSLSVSFEVGTDQSADLESRHFDTIYASELLARLLSIVERFRAHEFDDQFSDTEPVVEIDGGDWYALGTFELTLIERYSYMAQLFEPQEMPGILTSNFLLNNSKFSGIPREDLIKICDQSILKAIRQKSALTDTVLRSSMLELSPAYKQVVKSFYMPAAPPR